MIWSDKKWVDRTPFITAFLLEGANCWQLFRMWTEQSALGQSIWGWVQVHIAIWLWWNFYRVNNLKNAKIVSMLSIIVNGLVILSVAYFRYIKHQ